MCLSQLWEFFSIIKSNIIYVLLTNEMNEFASTKLYYIMTWKKIWFELLRMLSAFRRWVAPALRQWCEGTRKGWYRGCESRCSNLRLGRVSAERRSSRGKRYLRLRLSRFESHQQDDDIHYMSDLFVHCAYFDVHLRWVKRQGNIVRRITDNEFN